MELVDRELRRLLRTQIIPTQLPQNGRQRLLEIAGRPNPRRLAVLSQARLEAVTRPAIGLSESLRHFNESIWWLEIGLRV